MEASGDSTVISDKMAKLIEALQDSTCSLNAKHRSQNELRKLCKSVSSALPLLKTTLEGKQGYLFKKIILDCELQARNMQYLLDLVIQFKEPFLIKYALNKYHWIFKEETPFTDPKSLLTQILPIVSCTVRHTILWQLQKNCRNHSACDEIYTAIDSQIGPVAANILLPACSPGFVENLIQSKGSLKLTDRQFVWLMKKHPKKAVEYLKKDGVPSYPKLMRRIVRMDPLAYINMFEAKHQFGLEIDPVSTHYILKGCPQRILEKPRKYAAFLHKPTLFKHVKREDYIKFLICAFPTTLEHFKNYDYGIVGIYDAWINFLPSQIDKGDLFKEAFKLCYGIPLIDCPDCISPSILQIFSKKDRDTLSDIKLAELSVPEDFPSNYSVQKAKWIVFKPIEKSIPQLKSLISEESDHFNRLQLLCDLIKTCSINKDGLAMNQVCRYYADRHRNERQDTHERFIYDLATEFDSKFLELDEIALHYFVEILKTYMMSLEKDDYIQIPLSLLEKIYFAQVDNCLSTSWILPILFKKKLDDVLSWRPFWSFEKEKHHNDKYLSLIEIMVERLDTLPLKTPDDWCRFCIAILKWCQDWNKHCYRKKLSVQHFPDVEEKVPEILEKASEISKGIMDQFISALLADPNLSLNPSNPIYIKCLETAPNEKIILHFLCHNTLELKKNWKVIYKCLFHVGTNVTNIISRLKRNGFDWYLAELKKEFDAKVMEINNEGSEKMHAAVVGSLALPTDVFLSWAEKYYPKALEATTRAHYPPDTFLSFMGLRKGICSSLKNIEHPSRALPALLHFCAGDYLKLSLGSLYSVVLNSGFQQSKEFLLELSRRPAVSVKKHGIRLMTQVGCRDEVCEFLSEMWSKNEHTTIRDLILTEWLRRLPFDDTVWKDLKVGIQSLTPKDKDALPALLHQSDKISTHILEEYLDIVWRKYQDEKIKKAYNVAFVRSGIEMNFRRLSPDWIYRFVKENLQIGYADSGYFGEVVGGLLVNCILNLPTTHNSMFLTLLDEHLRKCWAEVVKCSGRSHIKVSPVIKFLGSFVSDLCRLSFSDENSRMKDELVQIFHRIQNFSVLAEQSALTFSIKLYLNLTAALHGDSDSKNMAGKGKIFGKILDEYILAHTEKICAFFHKKLLSFIEEIWVPWSRTSVATSDVAAHIDLAIGLMDSSLSNLNEKSIMALTFIPDTSVIPKIGESAETYSALIRRISESESYLVQLHYNDWAMSSHPFPDIVED